MYYIRTTKTGSEAIAVQIVKYVKRKTVVIRHIGSAHNSNELQELKNVGQNMNHYQNLWNWKIALKNL